MNSSYAIAAAILAPLIGLVHSSFSRSYGLAELYPASDVKRRIITLIWHLPSLTWSALAFAILATRISGTPNLPLTAATIFVFSASAIGNLWAHQKPFIGGILLVVVATLVAMDWLFNQ